MLSRYFGFSEDPFGTTPDPRFLYHSDTHREALASLLYGFHSNRGFTALIAPPGMGKTTLLFRFLDEIRDSARSVFLFDTQCEPHELMSYILRDLGLTPGKDRAEMHEQLHNVLLEVARSGRKFVVVVDEAQNLTDSALETVRLLTNFETPRSKLMQIVLSGQPQLSEKLMSPGLVQLRQRIATVCRLEEFSREETEAYVEHRLKFANYEGAPLFTEEAQERFLEVSRGTPRIINNLYFNALSLCCAMKRKQVDAEMFSEVLADQQLFPEVRGKFPPKAPALAKPPVESDQRRSANGTTKFRIFTAFALLAIFSPNLRLEQRDPRPSAAVATVAANAGSTATMRAIHEP